MKVTCKKTGKDMTKNVIEVLEKSINKKFVKTVSNTIEFDKWMEKLIKKNGVTKY
tara:strand:+ start:182 stop:346 length:165 start_codon:yes stop_codon:yes gene_type:complete